MSTVRVVLAAATLAALLAGCAAPVAPVPGSEPQGQRSEAPSSESAGSESGGSEVAKRPSSLQFKVQVEGMEETRTFQLAAVEGVPFTTYVPDGFEVKALHTAQGDGLAVTNNPSDPIESIEVLFLPASTSKSDAQAVLRTMMDAAGGGQDRDTPVWALEAHGAQVKKGAPNPGRWQNHEWILAQRGDRYFVVHVQYIMEAADGISTFTGPFYELWQWNDGKPLFPHREPIYLNQSETTSSR